MSQQLPFCTSLTKIKRDTAPGGLHASGWVSGHSPPCTTDTHTQSPSTSTWSLPWLLSLVSHIAISTDTEPARPPQHPPQPPGQAPILQTCQCTHNTQQSRHRCPRDRHSGRGSPGTQQQQPPVQLRAGTRVLYRVGGTLGRCGARTTLTDTTARGEGGAGADRAVPARWALCRARARILPAAQVAHGSGIAPGTAGTWHRQHCQPGHH